MEMEGEGGHLRDFKRGDWGGFNDSRKNMDE